MNLTSFQAYGCYNSSFQHKPSNNSWEYSSYQHQMVHPSNNQSISPLPSLPNLSQILSLKKKTTTKTGAENYYQYKSFHLFLESITIFTPFHSPQRSEVNSLAGVYGSLAVRRPSCSGLQSLQACSSTRPAAPGCCLGDNRSRRWPTSDGRRSNRRWRSTPAASEHRHRPRQT